MSDMGTRMTHFHSSDSRFCGDSTAARRFSFDENAVTCQGCKDNDRLYLSPEAAEYVASLTYVSEAK